MSNAADRTTRQILGRSMITAATWLDDLRRQLSRYILSFWRGSFERVGETLLGTRQILRSGLPIIGESLHYTSVISWVAGYDWMFRKLPADPKKSKTTTLEKDPRAENIRDRFPNLPLTPNLPSPFLPRSPLTPSPDPPQLPPPAIRWPGVFDDGPEEIRFPKIEEAANRMLERNVMKRDDFDAVSERFRETAFTVAGEMEEQTIESIRDVLAEDIREGTSLEGFKEHLEIELGSSPIGGAHLETVYRTNVQGAFRDGRETIMRDPIVDAMFPYQKYVPIHDLRVRHEHEQLGTLGLDGTGIYRRDDPFWDYYTPPWGYNCRCGVSPMTIEAAARQGVKEAQQWLKTGQPPEHPEYRISHIPFPSVPGFGSRGLVGT
ncbi:Phage Mu protein F like protein [Novipirellula galeiformis]|uniref:Phage Mu protein F like protein n=1 Tax=Novipirellula galeiformis TaxID=2528004 RepID=A0A5C6CFC8_9BACT|nr:phage minor head protein [Novipirellula galeiformis]TWU22447.1 Phage Mu protein F like protein [Novipirellula galeiformis]